MPFGPARGRLGRLAAVAVVSVAGALVSVGVAGTATAGPGTPQVSALKPAYGPATGGRRVKIVGTNLSGATTVLFGGSPATGVTANRKGTRVVAVAPAGTGQVDVQVTTGGGTSPMVDADHFSYAPAVTKVKAASGPDAGGNKVVITGTNFSGATTVLFGATPAPHFTVSALPYGRGGKITTHAPAGTPGTVDITVTGPGGTSPTTTADHYLYQ